MVVFHIYINKKQNKNRFCIEFYSYVIKNVLVNNVSNFIEGGKKSSLLLFVFVQIVKGEKQLQNHRVHEFPEGATF